MCIILINTVYLTPKLADYSFIYSPFSRLTAGPFLRRGDKKNRLIKYAVKDALPSLYNMQNVVSKVRDN